MLRYCRFRSSSSDSTSFLRLRFSDVTPQKSHISYCSIASNSSSKSPWYPLIRTAISEDHLLFGKSIHAVVIKHGQATVDRFLMNNLISMYSKCGSLSSARQLFDIMPQRDLVTWNSILAAYSSCNDSHPGNVEEGWRLFRNFLRSSDLSLTKLTFAPVLKLSLMTDYVWTSECVHGYALKIGLESEVLISGALVNIYIKFGKIKEARLMFDSITELDRDTVLWNIMLRAYVNSGLREEAFCFLSHFHHSEVVQPDIKSLQSILTSFSEDFDTKKMYKEQVQAYAIKLSLTDDEFAKVTSWRKTMSKHCQFGDHLSAIICFQDMNRSNIRHDDVTLMVSLGTVVPLNDLKLGEQIHSMALKSGLCTNVNVSNCLINMYSKMGCLSLATKLFFEMEETDIVSWNLMITNYVHSGLEEESVIFYVKLLQDGIKPDYYTLASVLKACSLLSTGLHLTEQIHVHTMKSGLDMDTFVSTSLLVSYSRNGRMKEAESLFLDNDKFDLGLWNAMMFGYINSGNSHRAWEFFIIMQRNGETPDEITLATMTNDCGFLGSLKHGRQIHGFVFKFGADRDLYVGSSLVHMYINCGEIKDAHRVFEEIPSPDNITWTSMISGYVENDDESRALLLYSKMRQSGVFPDEYTFATLLKACSYLTSLQQGSQIHANAIKFNCGSDTYVCTSLVDLYAKSGNIEEAFQVFKRTQVENVVLWNAMLLGLAQNGNGKEALDLFNDLKTTTSLVPDRVTFIGVLSACSHSGFISEAYTYLESMIKDYGIEPEIDHYYCLVDSLARAGRVQEAEKLITCFPFEVCGSMYRTLLAACRSEENMETGIRVATKVLKLQPFESSTYVLLSNNFASLKQWSEVANARKAMKSKNVKKNPGFSRIDVENKANVFVVDDRSHPQRKIIYDLVKLIKEDGYLYTSMKN